MKRIFYFLAFIALAVSCTKEPEDLTGVILGTVTESGSGTTPLSGVSVSILSNGMSTSTGSNGQFSFAKLEPKTYSLQFMKNGYVTDTRSVTMVAGKEIKCDMQLAAEKKEADIQINPSTLNFGTTQTELSVIITNNGNAETAWSLELGNNSWLTASPSSGRIASKKTQSIVFAVNRDKLPETKSVVVNLAAFGNSYPISVSCAPKNTQSEMKVEPVRLDFGTEAKELTMTIKNTGESKLNWSIGGITAACLSVSESSGSIVSAGNKVLKVTLNRDKMTENLQTTFIVSDGVKEETITVTATKVEKRAEMTVSPMMLDFGEDLTSLSFNIGNTGNAELSWSIPNVSDNSLSVSSTSGKVAALGSTKLTVTLNRTTMPKNLDATITVSDGSKQETVKVYGAKASGTSGMVVSSGLYTYYTFEGDYKDTSENEVHGFGSNAPTFVTGVTTGTKAVKFSRTNNSAFVVAKPLIHNKETTVSFWGKDFSDGNIFYVLSSYQSAPMFTLSMSGGSLKFVVTRYDNGYQYSKTGTFMQPALTDSKWHHIALTSDFNKTTYATITTTLYVDGQAVDTVTEYANPFSENGGDQSSYGTGVKFVMGGSIKLSNSVTLNGANMTVDNFRVYDTRRLTAAEVKSIYDAKQ